MAIGTTAALIGLGVGSSIAKGVTQRNAANKASQAQQRASQQVIDRVRGTVPEYQEELRRQAAAAQQGMTEAVGNAQRGVGEAAENAAVGVESAANNAAQNIDETSINVGRDVRGAADRGNQVLQMAYDEVSGTMQPYIDAGNGSLTRLSDLVDERFTFDENDPAYQWRLAEGQKAVERSAAGRGLTQSGATLKALTKYAQGAASQERDLAFNRFLADRGQRAGILNNVAGMGLNAGQTKSSAAVGLAGQASRNLTDAEQWAGNARMQGTAQAGQFRVGGATYGGNARMNAAEYSGNAGMQGAQYNGNIGMRGAEGATGLGMQGLQIESNALTGQGQATAAGHIGAGNAWADLIGGVGNAAMTGIMMKNLGSSYPQFGTPPFNPNGNAASNTWSWHNPALYYGAQAAR
jgi:hypothetical protein